MRLRTDWRARLEPASLFAVLGAVGDLEHVLTKKGTLSGWAVPAASRERAQRVAWETAVCEVQGSTSTWDRPFGDLEHPHSQNAGLAMDDAKGPGQPQGTVCGSRQEGGL
jgi:hypothetical protein